MKLRTRLAPAAVWLARALALFVPRGVLLAGFRLLPYRIRKRLSPGLRPRALLVGDCYYNFWFLSRKLREAGWAADTLRMTRTNADAGFLHGTDFEFFYRNRRDKFRHLLFLLRALSQYDVLHFYGVWNIRLFHSDFDWTLGGLLPESWEIRMLKALGKCVVYQNMGCPDGNLQTSRRNLPGGAPCDVCRWRDVPSVCSDQVNAAWGTVRNRLADLQVTMGSWHTDYNDSPSVREVPEVYCLDPEFWHPDLVVPANYRLPFPEGTIKIYHAVGNFDIRTDSDSNKNQKSTHVYIPTVERLKREGYPVELIFFKDVPNWQVRYYQAQADIVVDGLTSGFYGANAREAMMLGKPVVCRIRQERLEEVARQNPGFADELPIVSATPDTVYDVLVDLIEHPEKRAEIGRKSREFAVKWHSAEAGARRMSNLYLEVLTARRREA